MEPGLNIEVYENVLSSPDEIFQNLENQIQYLPAEKSTLCINGKECKIPRQLVAFGDPGLSYTFSGLTVSALPWTPLLLEIKKIVEQKSGCPYNFVLINRYKHGNDCIGQHKDSESDLVKNYPICSISLGEVRNMTFKRKNFEDYNVELKNNSMLLMKSPTNQLWSHGIAREPTKKGVRLNLTFRKMIYNNKRKRLDSMNKSNKKHDDSVTQSDKKHMDSVTQSDKKQNSGAFKSVPENMFPIGGDVFVNVSTFAGETLLHLRRYKKYGLNYYPTKEGVTFTPWQFDRLFSRTIPATQQELDVILNLLFDDFKFETTNFQDFTFTRNSKSKCGKIFSKSICISLNQWQSICNHVDNILTIALDYMFNEFDFKKLFEEIEGGVLTDSLPACSDVSNGTEYVSNLLYKSMCDLMRQNHRLITPMTYNDDIICESNTVKDFNTAALNMVMRDAAIHFHDELSCNQSFLALPVAEYVTDEFLKSVCFGKLIRKARKQFCPKCVE